jgi:hypothetical protein
MTKELYEGLLEEVPALIKQTRSAYLQLLSVLELLKMHEAEMGVIPEDLINRADALYRELRRITPTGTRPKVYAASQ